MQAIQESERNHKDMWICGINSMSKLDKKKLKMKTTFNTVAPPTPEISWLYLTPNSRFVLF